jgi:hypothetical protein
MNNSPLQGEVRVDVVAPCISIYRDIFNPKDFIQLIEDESQNEWPYVFWENSGTGAGIVSDYRMSFQMSLEPIAHPDVPKENRMHRASKLLEQIWAPINQCVFEYRNKHSLDLERDEGLRLLKYSGGAEYKAHYDAGPGMPRVLSLVAWINDDYDGGHLEFPFFNTTIQPSAGGVVIFPANFAYTHYAHPVGENNNDIKYSLVTWFQ